MVSQCDVLGYLKCEGRKRLVRIFFGRSGGTHRGPYVTGAFGSWRLVVDNFAVLEASDVASTILINVHDEGKLAGLVQHHEAGRRRSSGVPVGEIQSTFQTRSSGWVWSWTMSPPNRSPEILTLQPQSNHLSERAADLL